MKLLKRSKTRSVEGDAYDFMRFESNSTLKMYEKESLPEAGKPCQLKPENDNSRDLWDVVDYLYLL